jgi:hypothetical protein
MAFFWFLVILGALLAVLAYTQKGSGGRPEFGSARNPVVFFQGAQGPTVSAPQGAPLLLGTPPRTPGVAFGAPPATFF